MTWKNIADMDFAVSVEDVIDQAETREGKNNHKVILAYFNDRPIGKLLDVGEFSPLTDKLQRRYRRHIHNTYGDLDMSFKIPGRKYDTILTSHNIEHLFNPLSFLLRLRKVLRPITGRLIIATPWCSENLKLSFSSCHYHEIDERRMGKLIKRAGFELVSIEYYKRYRGGFYGIRPLIKWINAKNVIYELKILEGKGG